MSGGVATSGLLAAIVAGGGQAGMVPADSGIRYWISAETATVAPWPGSPPGETVSVYRRLELALGSPLRPDGRARAEHVVPAGLGLGAAIRLATPEPMANVRAAPPARALPRQSAPRPGAGHVRIYWGCGDHVRRGQPLTINEADLRQGRGPPALAAWPFRRPAPPDDRNAATFGQWSSIPNRAVFPPGASLAGDHLLRGNYIPDIRFTLAPGQDFLPPILLTADRPRASGAVEIAWQPVAGARGFFLKATQLDPDGALVWWTSSERPFSNYWSFFYLAPSDLARMLRSRMLLRPSAIRCVVPAEIVRRPGSTVVNVHALGPEVDIGDPVPGAPAWTVKLHTLATYSGRLGQ